jgi:hypothetical protein
VSAPNFTINATNIAIGGVCPLHERRVKFARTVWWTTDLLVHDTILRAMYEIAKLLLIQPNPVDGDREDREYKNKISRS